MKSAQKGRQKVDGILSNEMAEADFDPYDTKQISAQRVRRIKSRTIEYR